MARPLRIQFPGALYHITNRGNERSDIFKDDIDRRTFLKILSQSIETYGIVLHSFVLMKNHWHLLALTPLGNLSDFMRHLNITYTSHFNRRHNRVGHLYQGRYNSFLVELNSYLSQASRYIHLNPIKVSGMEHMPIEKRLHYLWNYKWSSLPGYIGQAKKLDFVENSYILDKYGGDTAIGRNKYKQQILDDLSAKLTIRDKVIAQTLLGSDKYITWIRDTFINSKNDRERPNVSAIQQYLSLEKVASIVEEKTGTENIFCSCGTNRQILMTALYKYANLNNREIGELLGVDYSTVSQGRTRLRKKAQNDKAIYTLLNDIEAKASKIKI